MVLEILKSTFFQGSFNFLHDHAPQHNVVGVDGQLGVGQGEADQDDGGGGGGLTSEEQEVSVSTRDLERRERTVSDQILKLFTKLMMNPIPTCRRFAV